jgi:glycosyltransferase involved in cell wall biosynthesis
LGNERNVLGTVKLPRLKRLLFLTFYYPPDLCAGSFRAGALVDRLRAKYGSELEIEVLTTMPNRYQSFQRYAQSLEQKPGLTVYRYEIKSHKSGLVDQSLSFMAFARQVLQHVAGRNFDLVFATSSRLMTAALAATVARRIKAPLYLDIRDLFTDTMSEVLDRRLRWIFLPAFRWIERFTFRSASVINIVSPGFEKYVDAFKSKIDLRYFTNGIDEEFLEYKFPPVEEGSKRRVILYAGNIGAGQGLHRLIPEAAAMLAATHDFVIVGDGGAREVLEKRCVGLDNVRFELPVDRGRLIAFYAEADILLMHLNEFTAFRKVLPSKIFEYAATGRPILAGVAGFAAEFTESHVENAVVFKSCDADGMVRALNKLKLASIDRSDFKAEFSRTKIMDEFATDLFGFMHDH